MKKIKGGVTAAAGFTASGIATGVKRVNPDLALVCSQKTGVCAGFFTTNKVKAAPVLLSSALLKNPTHKGVVINSGCANCLTGKKGLLDAKIILKKLTKLLKLKSKELLICSTGHIGDRLNMKKILPALGSLVKNLSKNAATKAAKAIMTTDTYKKEFACSFKIKNKEVRIGGMAKGSGMIAPNMATTICVVTTDADISKSTLNIAAKEAIEDSFNSITVDGDMSTNDTFLCFANGASGVKIKPNTAEYKKFLEVLKFVALSLAKMVVDDGEGATKFVQVEIKGAKTKAQAKKIAFGIANSSLVKTAICGCDPNVGRIASACGAADKDVILEKLEIYVGNKKILKNGTILTSKGLRNIFKVKNIEITCDLKIGKHKAKVYTCDLSHEYIRINADYENST